MTIDAMTELTCENEDCDCSLLVQSPCPLGTDYRCGCGARLVPAEDVPGDSGVVGPPSGNG